MLRRLFFLILLSCAVLADTPQFRTFPMDIPVKDKYDRPYEIEDNQAYIGVRLAQDEKQTNKEVSKYETLSCAGIEYARQTQDYVKFPLQGGVAKVQFIIFEDIKAPVDYELALIQDNVVHPLTPTVWQIGTESTGTEIKAESLLAPHTAKEKAIIALFGVVAVVLGYYLLGRRLFARMLQKRNMDVSSALGWSNLLVVLSWALAGVSVGCMVFFPIMVWQKLYWIYVLVPGAYFLLLGLVYGTGLLATRN